MRERRVHLERLARLLRLLLLAEVLDRPHVVQAVGELDEDDADVLRHRDDHLPVVLGLGLLAALERDPRQLRDALDELRDLGAELRAELVELRARVLDDVVQERGRDRLLVEVELRADARDAERMVDELLAGAPRLPRVRALRDLERTPQEILVDVRVVGLDLGDQLLDEVFVLSLGVENAHVISVLSAFRAHFAGAGGPARAPKSARRCGTFRRWLRQRRARGSRSSCATRSFPPARPRLIRPVGRTVRPRAAAPRRPRARGGRGTLGLEQLPAPRRLRRSSPSSAKTRRASGVQASSPCRQSPASARAQLLVAVRRVEEPAHDELRRDRPVPAVLLQPAGDVEAALRAQPVELRALAERDRAAGVAAVLADAEAEVLPLADGRGRDGWHRGRAASRPGSRARTARAARAPARGRA